MAKTKVKKEEVDKMIKESGLVSVLREGITSDLKSWPDTAETYKALTKIIDLIFHLNPRNADDGRVPYVGKSEAGIYAPRPKKTKVVKAKKKVAKKKVKAKKKS